MNRSINDKHTLACRHIIDEARQVEGWFDQTSARWGHWRMAASSMTRGLATSHIHFAWVWALLLVAGTKASRQ